MHSFAVLEVKHIGKGICPHNFLAGVVRVAGVVRAVQIEQAGRAGMDGVTGVHYIAAFVS